MSIRFLVLSLAVSSLSACLFDDKGDDENRTLTLSGALADLDTLPHVTPDSGGPTYQAWFLAVDSADLDAIGGGSCFYTGYLGDSAQTTYTNALMAGQKTAQVIRSEGVQLYRDTAEPAYTRYRVVFDCFD